MKGGEDESVVPRLPGELDAGGVGDTGNWDAVAVLGGRTQRLWHLLFAHAPVGGHEGNAAQEERHDRLDEGEAGGTHLLQECHHTRGRGGFEEGLGLVEEKYAWRKTLNSNDEAGICTTLLKKQKTKKQHVSTLC